MGNLQTHEKTMTARQRRRIVAAACMGNYLEWFDFGIYAYFAVVIGKLFSRPEMRQSPRCFRFLFLLLALSRGRSARWLSAAMATGMAARMPCC